MTKMSRQKLREARGFKYLSRWAEIKKKFNETRLRRWPEYQKRFMDLIDQGAVVPTRYLKKYKLTDYKTKKV